MPENSLLSLRYEELFSEKAQETSLKSSSNALSSLKALLLTANAPIYSLSALVNSFFLQSDDKLLRTNGRLTN